MRQKSIAAVCSSVLVGFIGVAGVVSGAHATVYVGGFDPRGDVYGFSGTDQFSVDDACLQGTDWQQVNTENSCGTVALLSGSLTLSRYESAAKDVNGNYTDNNTVLQQTFNFAASIGSSLPDSSDIFGIYVAYDETTQRNELAGVDSYEIGPVAYFDNLYWWLEWSSGYAGDDPVTLFSAPCKDPYSYDCIPQFADVPPATTVTFTRIDSTVPEPGSLGLALAALVALRGVGVTRRQRSAR